MRPTKDSPSHSARAMRGVIFAASVVATLAFVCLNGCSPSPPAHGTSFLVRLQANQEAILADHSNQLTRASKVLDKRLDRFGVNYSIERMTPERLLIKVQVDGNSRNAARDLISRHGLLEFRMVHKNSAALIEQGITEPGYEVLKEEVTRGDGQKTIAAYLVRKAPERGLTGKYIDRVTVMRNQVTKKPEIGFEFDGTGARLFEQITTEYQPAGNQLFQLGIVLDGQLVSAPQITGVISGGRGVVNGNFKLYEAIALAGILENPLEASLLILDERSF